MRVGDRLLHEQRRLRLHVVHVSHVGDAGRGHRPAHSLRDLLDHRWAADVLRQQHVGHRDADGEALVPRRRGAAPLVRHTGEHGRVRRDDPVAATGPRHRDLLDLLAAACAAVGEDAPERLVGEDAGEVVDTAVAFGLPDDGDDLIGPEGAVLDESLEARGVRHAQDLDLADLDRHLPLPLRRWRSPTSPWGRATPSPIPSTLPPTDATAYGEHRRCARASCSVI